MGIMSETEAKELVKDTIATLPPVFQVCIYNFKSLLIPALESVRLYSIILNVLTVELSMIPGFSSFPVTPSYGAIPPLSSLTFIKEVACLVHLASGVEKRYKGGVT